MILLLVVFSHAAVLSAAAWMTVTPNSLAPHRGLHNSGHQIGSHRKPSVFMVATPTKARNLFKAVTLASPFSNKIFARGGETSPLLSRTTRQLSAKDVPAGGDGGNFQWSLATVVQALVVFVLSGIAEIGGGWLVWKAVRESKPWWWALVGSCVMVLYAFLPTLQPTDSFGRIYAVYGGFFIALSYAWGWLFDGMKPDAGDVVGGSLALVAVLVILFWPRQQ